MKSLRYALRLSVAFIKRFRSILILSVLFGFLAFGLLTFFAPRLFLPTTRIGISGRYHADELPMIIQQEIGDGLTMQDENGLAVPALAQSWEQSEEGKVWTFQLDSSKMWHDETPITSDNMIFNFADVDVERPDAKTLVFRLSGPFAPFPTVVSKPIFKKERGLVGTGEWVVKNITEVDSYVSELFMQNEKGEKKLYKFYPTESQAKLAYKLGEVDFLENIFDPAPLNSWDTTETRTINHKDQVVTLFFNTEDPLLADKGMRQALMYSIDKTSFNGERAISPVAPGSWAYNSQVKKYTYDPERADELLDDFPDELLEKPLQIVSTPTLLPVAESIASFFRERGLNTVVQVSSVIPSEFQVYLTILDTPQDPDQYALWHSTQATNISRYQNDRIDKLLEDGRLTLEQEERRRIYLDFQRFLLEDLPAGFLYHPQTFVLERK